MSRQVTAPRGVTTFNDLADRSLTSNGTMIEGGNKNPDWFKGQYPYNVTSTPAQAAKLAQALADKLATYLIDASVVGKNCLRLAVSSQKAINTAVLNIPTAAATGLTSSGGPVPGWPVPYMFSDGTGATGFAGGQGQVTFGSSGTGYSAGSTFTVNPAYILQSDALIDFLARNMAVGYLDALLLGLYAQFTSNSPVGTSNSTLATATLTAALALLTGQASYQGGTPVFFVLPEQNSIDLNTVALEPNAGYIATDFNTGRRRIYSGAVIAEIFFSEKVAITASVNKHGLSFCPSAIALASAQVTAPNIDPSSGAVLTTTAMVSSVPVNNFVASVKYGLAASSGNNFAFNVLPNAGVCVVDNALGCRVES